MLWERIGSHSAAFMMTVPEGPKGFAYFTAAGNPAPPRPTRPDARIMSSRSAGASFSNGTSVIDTGTSSAVIMMASAVTLATLPGTDA